MKMSLVILSAFLSVSAFATPRVGDTVTYSGTTTKGSSVEVTTGSLQIMSFDASASTYTVHSEMIVGSKADISDNVMKDTEVLTEERGAAYVADCLTYGGTLEMLNTVPTGSIETCKVSNGGSDAIWVGAIPFAMVKLSQGGMVITVDSITRGP